MDLVVFRVNEVSLVDDGAVGGDPSLDLVDLVIRSPAIADVRDLLCVLYVLIGNKWI